MNIKKEFDYIDNHFDNIGKETLVNLQKQNIYGDWLSEDNKIIHVTHWFELKD